MKYIPVENRGAIRRQNVEKTLLITLLSFAGSVSITRLFLYLTGYPQIGGGELHIAHVLWGGVLLFAACLVMLIFANRWVYDLGAFLAGVGVGLFIDEVGKFITKTNDYFYPTAAPIIYAFFLLTVLIFVIFRKRRNEDARTTLYYALDELQEVLDHDLNDDERDRIRNQLHEIIKRNERPDLTLLAKNLDGYIDRKRLYIVPKKKKVWDTWRQYLMNFEVRWFTHKKMKFILLGATFALAIWTLWYASQVLLFSIRNPQEFNHLIAQLVSNNLVRNATGLNWFEARVGLEGAIGILLLVTAFLLLIGKEKSAILLGYPTLVFTLAIVNLLVFYFDQFSTVFDAIIQFFILLGFLRFRSRFLKNI